MPSLDFFYNLIHFVVLFLNPRPGSVYSMVFEGIVYMNMHLFVCYKTLSKTMAGKILDKRSH